MKKALFSSSAVIALIMVVGCAPPAPTEMGAVVGSYTSFNLERAVRDSQRLIEELDIDENGMPSFRRALESAQELLDTGIEGELISNSVIELMAWQYFFTPHDQHIPPIPLIETNHKIVTPPPGVHPFYRKYVNAYEDDYTKGIVIITSDAVPDRAIRKVEQTVNKLLSARPDLRVAMSSNNIRVAIRGVAEARDNSDHPGDIGPGGARPERPTTYSAGSYTHVTLAPIRRV